MHNMINYVNTQPRYNFNQSNYIRPHNTCIHLSLTNLNIYLLIYAPMPLNIYNFLHNLFTYNVYINMIDTYVH